MRKAGSFMPDTVKTVIFDIDNTLYCFTEANKLALGALSRYMGEHFGWTPQEFEQRHKAVQEEIYSYTNYNGSCRNRMIRYQKLLEQASLPLFPHALNLYSLYWDTLLGAIRPFEGAGEVMRTLKERGMRIGICTDMTAYMQLRKLETLGLLRYVDFMVSSEEVGEEKPSPGMFRMCIRKAGCSPEECLFVGDHPEKDIGGALSCGMQALWFAPDEITFE